MNICRIHILRIQKPNVTAYYKHLKENLIIICRSYFNFRYRNGLSFEGISDAYNDVHFGQDWSLQSDVRVLDRRRLSEAWFQRHLIKWKIELGETEIRPLTCAEVDAEIQSYMTNIGEHFSRKWSGNHHHDNCMSKGV